MTKKFKSSEEAMRHLYETMKEFAERDENGNIIVIKGQPTFSKDVTSFLQQYGEFKEKSRRSRIMVKDYQELQYI